MAKTPPVRQLKGRMLGRILIKMRVVTRDKVHTCLKIQQKDPGKKKLGEIMMEKGLINEEQLLVALAGQRGMDYVDLDSMEISPDIISMLQSQMANNYRVIPIEHDASRNELTVAIDSPDNFRATDDLSTLLGMAVNAKVSTESAIDAALERYYAEDDGSIEIDKNHRHPFARLNSLKNSLSIPIFCRIIFCFADSADSAFLR